jgi:thioesterase domain-containing protein
MARRLTETGKSVEFLALIDTAHPSSFPVDAPYMGRFDENQSLLDTVAHYWDGETERNVRQFSTTLSFEELVKHLYAHNLIPNELDWAKDLDAGAIHRILATRHATVKAVISCSLVELNSPVWLFEAVDNKETVAAAWTKIAGLKVHTIPIPGTHLTMMSEENNLKYLGAAVTAAICGKPG